MEFWAIAYVWKEEVYYDLDNQVNTDDLRENCLLPTKDMALQYIEENLDMDYEVVKITVEKFDGNGEWYYNRETFERWDG